MTENKSGINPTGHHVLVLPDRVEEKTKGGIYLPQESQDDKQRAATKGLLVAVGLTSWLEFAGDDPWAMVGDYVSYAKYGGINMVGTDDVDYVLLNDQDILAVLDNCD